MELKRSLRLTSLLVALALTLPVGLAFSPAPAPGVPAGMDPLGLLSDNPPAVPALPATALEGAVTLKLPVDFTPKLATPAALADLARRLEQRAAAPTGPAIPELGNSDGIGPGSALLQSATADGSGDYLCTASYLFQSGGKAYLATAGHCLVQDEADPTPRSGRVSAPSTLNNQIFICVLECVMNGLQLGEYVALTPSAGYHPVAFAMSGGIGNDVGFLEIPAQYTSILRPWLPQFGGPDAVGGGELGDLMVHFGHGSYCCPGVGAVGTRTPADQGRLALSLGNDGEAITLHAQSTGGDSGSAIGTATADPDRIVQGLDASGIITHGLIVGTGYGAATVLSHGVDEAEAFFAAHAGIGLPSGGLELIPQNGALNGGGGEDLVPAVTITSPGAGAEIPVGDLTVSGIVDRAAESGPANQAPTATLSADATTGPMPLDVEFTLGGSDTDGTIASYSFDFGDGSPGTSGTTLPATLSHTYGAGAFTAELTVVDDGGLTDTASVVISPSSGGVSCLDEADTDAPTPWDLTSFCLEVVGGDLVATLGVNGLEPIAATGCVESPATWGFWLEGLTAGPVEVYCFETIGVANWAGGQAFDTAGTAALDGASGTITVTVPISELTGMAVPYAGHAETWNGPGAYGGRPMWLGGSLLRDAAGAPDAFYVDRLPDAALTSGASSPGVPRAANLVVGLASALGGSAATPQAAVVPGVAGDIGPLTVTDHDGVLEVRMALNGALDAQVPGPFGSPMTYDVQFTTDHNGLDLTYRLGYAYTLDETNAPGGGDEFTLTVLSAAANGLQSYCPVAADLSASHYDLDSSSAVWVVPLAAFKATNLVPQGNCAPLDLSGRGLETDDVLADVVGGATAQVAILSLGDLRATTAPFDYTVVGDGEVVDPVVERVVLFLDGIEVGDDEVSTSGASPTATWSIDTVVAAGSHVLRAEWIGADDVLIAFTERAISVLDEGCEAPEGDEHGGGSGLCSGNLAPEIFAGTFDLLGSSILEKDGNEQALSFQVDVQDLNGADTLDGFDVAFTPATGIALRATDPIVVGAGAEITDAVVTVHFVVSNAAPVGTFDVVLAVTDSDGLSDSATFEDVFEVIPTGVYFVDIVGGDALQFDEVFSGSTGVESVNHFTVRNLLHETNAFEFTMEDFVNLAVPDGCSATTTPPGQTQDCIELADNLELVIDPSPEGDDEFTFTGDDLVTTTFSGGIVSLGQIADGGIIGVKLVIQDVGILHVGSFGSTFSVPEPTPVA